MWLQILCFMSIAKWEDWALNCVLDLDLACFAAIFSLEKQEGGAFYYYCVVFFSWSPLLFAFAAVTDWSFEDNIWTCWCPSGTSSSAITFCQLFRADPPTPNMWTWGVWVQFIPHVLRGLNCTPLYSCMLYTCCKLWNCGCTRSNKISLVWCVNSTVLYLGENSQCCKAKDILWVFLLHVCRTRKI